MSDLTEIVTFAVLFAALLVGFTIYQRWKVRSVGDKLLSDNTEFCAFCGNHYDTDTCPECGFDEQQLQNEGFDDHVELLKALGQIEDALQRAHREAKMTGRHGLGRLFNVGFRKRDRLRDRLSRASQVHIEALQQLNDALDEHSELLDEIEAPDTGEPIAEALEASYSVPESPSFGLLATIKQMFALPREINEDRERIDSARKTVARHLRQQRSTAW